MNKSLFLKIQTMWYVDHDYAIPARSDQLGLFYAPGCYCYSISTEQILASATTVHVVMGENRAAKFLEVVF